MGVSKIVEGRKLSMKNVIRLILALILSSIVILSIGGIVEAKPRPGTLSNFVVDVTLIEHDIYAHVTYDGDTVYGVHIDYYKNGYRGKWYLVRSFDFGPGTPATTYDITHSIYAMDNIEYKVEVRLYKLKGNGDASLMKNPYTMDTIYVDYQ